MISIEQIIKIFQSECCYNKINEISNIKMRKSNNGISLIDAIYCRFLYAQKEMTKERITSIINNNNDNQFSRQAFWAKENNIPIQMYNNILSNINKYYNSNFNNEDNFKLIGIDGTYNNDLAMNDELNMGFYDITNGIPIDIKSYGHENKNNEIYATTDYISNNFEIFKNNIIVADRAYFAYDFLNFLTNKGIKYIIRCKGEADNLQKTNILRPSTPKYSAIINVRNNCRIIKYDNILQKTVYSGNSKKNSREHKLEVKNDCIIVTNLLDEEKYPDNKILELYKSRWDIEIFFKYIKSNYKFQHLKEKEKVNHQKMYICELIITYIARIIEETYMRTNKIKKSTNGKIYKINRSNLINGIFDSLLYKILVGKLKNSDYDKFCKSYIILIENKINRSYPRTSKTPFTKWYVKGYSEHSKYLNIISAIINNTVDKLNKNLKNIAKKIISIDGIKYN